jgi:biotin carboxylase
MPKTLLIVSGGVEAVDAAKRARELGHYVVVSDCDPEAPGFEFADSRLIADVYGSEQTAAAAERFSRKVRRIDGVICVAADAPMTVAAVSERLGIGGLSRESAHLASDKLAMKERFREAGVPIPWFAAVDTPQALARIAVERGSDLVIKPVDSRGSRGVQRLAKVSDLNRAFAFATSYSPTGRVMAEQYLSGPQVSTETVVVDGRCFTPVLSDRNYEFLDRFAPFFIENGGELPSRLSHEIQEKIKGVVAQAATALGIRNGTVKGDIVVHDGEAFVIEMAARLSGGYFCTKEIPLASGVDFVGVAIRIALGELVQPEELLPRASVPVVQRYAFPAPGRIVSIRGAEDARRLPGVADVVMTAKLGDVIPPAGDKRPSAAMVLATGDTHEAALACANGALAQIRIETA